MRVLVTGAGSGIGQAVADALHARGDALMLLARNEQRAGDLALRYPGSDVGVADLGEPGSVAPAVAGVGALDAVVHAAGVITLGPVAEQALDSLVAQVTVNLVAPAELTRALLPALRASRGTVVFLNSGAGLSAHAGWSAYAASKFGLRAFADALRAEEAGSGVRVTTVFPGRTATPMQQRVHEHEGRDYDPAAWSAPETVAASVLHVLDLPPDSTLTELVLRPR